MCNNCNNDCENGYSNGFAYQFPVYCAPCNGLKVKTQCDWALLVAGANMKLNLSADNQSITLDSLIDTEAQSTPTAADMKVGELKYYSNKLYLKINDSTVITFTKD